MKAKIRIDVVGGVAHIVMGHPNVDIEIRDYDVQGDEDNLEIDESGDEYVSA